MSWGQPEYRYRNEQMMLGPHRLIATMQQEMNDLGREDKPWSCHSWDLTPLGWCALMVRSVEIKPSEDA